MVYEIDEDPPYKQGKSKRRSKQIEANKRERRQDRFLQKYKRTKTLTERGENNMFQAIIENDLPDPTETAIEDLEYWGIASAIDIYNCQPEKIRDADLIRTFVVELCDLIEMKRFGETQVVHFGEDEKVAGYSMIQLIETSLISAHFANLSNAVYLDVFSCKAYDPETVRIFAQKFFGGAFSALNVTYRR